MSPDGLFPSPAPGQAARSRPGGGPRPRRIPEQAHPAERSRPGRTGQDRDPAGGRTPAADAAAHRPGPARARPEDGPQRFAAIWSRAVYPLTATSMTRVELESYLLPLVGDLCATMDSDPFDLTPARQAGGRLVGAHCTDPRALEQSLAVIDAYLPLYRPPGLRLPAETEHHRLSRLQHAFAAGFTEALRGRTLTEQEAISRAALTARVRAERALQASEAKFRALFQDAAVGIGIGDLQGRILDANAALARMFGLSMEDMLATNVNDLVHPDDEPEVWEHYGELIRGERELFQVEKPYFTPSGGVVWADLTVSLIRDADGRPRYQVAMLQDITDRHLLHERLRHQATHDPLTGLANRTLFLEQLEAALAPETGAARVGLCYLDLDGFKAVNDSLGHDAGDRLLVTVAERFRACLTRPGQLVARMGGDEFTVLAVDPVDEAEMLDLARRFLDSLDEPVHLDGQELSVTVSVGVVESATRGVDASALVQGADITLYRAKAAGGNRWAVYDAESNAREVARYTLSTHLPAALERGEFFLDYQPLVSLADGTVEAVEALVRWRHPQHGLLGPDRFVPLAEDTGLIVPLGRWILEQACRQARMWQRELPGPAPRVNVNLAVQQARNAGLVQDVARALADTGLEPDVLRLEVTESALLGADDDALRALRELTGMGVQIALDDFGTGYSNLSYLRWLPVHCIKIDRSFVEGLRHPDRVDPIDGKIVAGLVSLAHTLGHSVAVEGVETAVQAERVRKLGCDTAQGWFFARPGPPDQVARLCRERAAPPGGPVPARPPDVPPTAGPRR